MVRLALVQILLTCCVVHLKSLHKSERREDIREPCHTFHRVDIHLQETIPWVLQETVGKKCAETGPSSVASSFRTLGGSSSGPKGFKPLRSLVTLAFQTTLSSMKGANLLRNGTSLCSFLLNTSINWPLNSSAYPLSESVMPVPPHHLRSEIHWLSFFWLLIYR